MTTLRSQRGQAMVMSIAFLTVLLGMAALVVDVGSWYRADRHAQLTADAAALAGAQALPDDPGRAAALAVEYADKNEGGIANGGVELPSANRIKVTVERPAPGFFSKLFGIDSVDVRATAAATVGTPSEALYVAPIVVNEKHPDLQRFGVPTELEYHHLKETGPTGPDGSGSFGFINLDHSDSNPGTSTMRNWIENGFDQYMPIGDYDARTGNPFSGIEDTLDGSVDRELLFPIYRKLTGTGSGAKYEIIGWVGFHLTGSDLTGSNEKLFGYFTKVIWQGIQGASGSSFSPGVGVVQLVE
jgi:Flp pilus assembly protein TadG